MKITMQPPDEIFKARDLYLPINASNRDVEWPVVKHPTSKVDWDIFEGYDVNGTINDLVYEFVQVPTTVISEILKKIAPQEWNFFWCNNNNYFRVSLEFLVASK